MLMDLTDIMSDLEALGSEQTRKVFRRHGAKDPFFGVKIADMKKLVSKIKKANKADGREGLHKLALELYDTGNSDAMYMAAFMVDPEKITRKELQRWVEGAYWYMISDYTVAWTASASPYGWEMANEWMKSDNQFIASAGWATVSSILSVKPDEELDKDSLQSLMESARKEVHSAKNRVRYAMNNFLIAAGSFVPDLTEKAKSLGSQIGTVEVDMGGTSCKVPAIVEYIEKVEKRGKVGQKRKSPVC
jgi:3-methyladenine DNA glycosylase AlkD